MDGSMKESMKNVKSKEDLFAKGMVNGESDGDITFEKKGKDLFIIDFADLGTFGLSRREAENLLDQIRLELDKKDEEIHPFVRPCPFCGEIPVFNEYDGCDKKWVQVKCGNISCKAMPHTGGYASEKLAAEAWNERGNQQAPKEVPEDDDEDDGIDRVWENLARMMDEAFREHMSRRGRRDEDDL